MIHHASLLSSLIPGCFPLMLGRGYVWGLWSSQIQEPKTSKTRYTLRVAMPAGETHLKQEHGDQDKEGSRRLSTGHGEKQPRLRAKDAAALESGWEDSRTATPTPGGPLRAAFFSIPALSAGEGPVPGPQWAFIHALSSDWSTLWSWLAPHNLLVTGLLSKMGPRLVRPVPMYYASAAPDKASVCGSWVGWGLGPDRVLFTRHWLAGGGDGGGAGCRR